MLGKKDMSSTVENSALVAGEAYAGQKRSEEKPHVWCDYCNKPRHTRETC